MVGGTRPHVHAEAGCYRLWTHLAQQCGERGGLVAPTVFKTVVGLAVEVCSIRTLSATLQFEMWSRRIHHLGNG